MISRGESRVGDLVQKFNTLGKNKAAPLPKTKKIVQSKVILEDPYSEDSFSEDEDNGLGVKQNVFNIQYNQKCVLLSV